MIYYEGNYCRWLKVFQLKGSTYPKSLTVALPCAIIAGFLRYYRNADSNVNELLKHDILNETQAWAGFSVLVGFLIVFRTSQAYTRFWDGCTATHMMRAEWFDACSALVAFCAHSSADKNKVMSFKHIIVRLFSMLHAAALAELEDSTKDNQALKFELIDADALDPTTLRAVKTSGDRVELIFGWIQLIIVENVTSGVMTIPAPILSRAFQEIANGMVAFHEAMQISYIPFPFPYAQTCDLLLLLHWLIVPCVTMQWVHSPFWAAVFVFVQVFPLWSLNFIAVEIENPFGADANDLDGHHMQLEMNRQLTLLLSPLAAKSPRLRNGFDIEAELPFSSSGSRPLLRQDKSFADIWAAIEGQQTPTQREKKFARSRTSSYNMGPINMGAFPRGTSPTSPRESFRKGSGRSSSCVDLEDGVGSEVSRRDSYLSDESTKVKRSGDRVDIEKGRVTWQDGLSPSISVEGGSTTMSATNHHKIPEPQSPPTVDGRRPEVKPSNGAKIKRQRSETLDYESIVLDDAPYAHEDPQSFVFLSEGPLNFVAQVRAERTQQGSQNNCHDHHHAGLMSRVEI